MKKDSSLDTLLHERREYNRNLLRQATAAFMLVVGVVFYTIVLTYQLWLDDPGGQNFRGALVKEIRSFPGSDVAIQLLGVSATIVVVVAIQGWSRNLVDSRNEVGRSVLSAFAELTGITAAGASGLWFVKGLFALGSGQSGEVGEVLIALLLFVSGSGLAAVARVGLDVRVRAVDETARKIARLLRWRPNHKLVDSCIAAGFGASWVIVFSLFGYFLLVGEFPRIEVEALAVFGFSIAVFWVGWAAVVCKTAGLVVPPDVILSFGSRSVAVQGIFFAVGGVAIVLSLANQLAVLLPVLPSVLIGMVIVLSAQSAGLLIGSERAEIADYSGQRSRLQRARVRGLRIQLERDLGSLAEEESSLAKAALAKYSSTIREN